MADDAWGARWDALAATTPAADSSDPDHVHTWCGPTRRQLLGWAGAWSAFVAELRTPFLAVGAGVALGTAALATRARRTNEREASPS